MQDPPGTGLALLDLPQHLFVRGTPGAAALRVLGSIEGLKRLRGLGFRVQGSGFRGLKSAILALRSCVEASQGFRLLGFIDGTE